MPTSSDSAVPATASVKDVAIVRRKAETSQMFSNQRTVSPSGGKVR